MSLVSFDGENMSSSSKERLQELLRNRMRRQPRNFEQRRRRPLNKSLIDYPWISYSPGLLGNLSKDNGNGCERPRVCFDVSLLLASALPVFRSHCLMWMASLHLLYACLSRSINFISSHRGLCPVSLACS